MARAPHSPFSQKFQIFLANLHFTLIFTPDYTSTGSTCPQPGLHSQIEAGGCKLAPRSDYSLLGKRTQNPCVWDSMRRVTWVGIEIYDNKMKRPGSLKRPGGFVLCASVGFEQGGEGKWRPRLHGNGHPR